MHAKRIVARVLEPCLGQLHAKRAAALQRSVLAVVLGGALSLSSIALAMGGALGLRHRIKSVDRLLGNTMLEQSRLQIYEALARQWLNGLPKVLLVVDWSDLSPDQRWHWLRASVVVNGRGVTLYEEVHPQRLYANREVHRRFLACVADLLPAGCVPIVMTDAGFHSTWFKLVEALGWSYVGRIRGRDMVRQADGPWARCKALYAQARPSALDLGRWSHVRSNCIECRLVLIKEKPRGRHRLNLRGKRRINRSSIDCATAAREPWLLAVSPALDQLTAQSIVKFYAQRMTIEESFRDTKNLRWGQGLQITRSRSRTRLQMLLLIAHLASFVQRLIGEDAKAHQLELQFSPTNRTSRPQISVLALARRILAAPSHWLDQLMPWTAIPPLTMQARQAWASG
jgi:Transposase DDE domain